MSERFKIAVDDSLKWKLSEQLRSAEWNEEGRDPELRKAIANARFVDFELRIRRLEYLVGMRDTPF